MPVKKISGTKTTNIKKMSVSDKGLELISSFESIYDVLKSWNLGQFDSSENLLGIYPMYIFKKQNNNWISDGGITFGYGHWVSVNDYKNISSEKALVDKYAKGAPLLPKIVPKNGVPYKVPNSIPMPMNEVLVLYKEDILEAENALNNFIKKNNLNLKQNQFDALVSLIHQNGPNIFTLKTHIKLQNFIIKGNGVYNKNDATTIFNSYGGGSKGKYETRRKKELEVFLLGY